MNTDVPFLSNLGHFFLKWEIFQTKVVEKIKTHILCSVNCFSENRAVYEIMWDIVQPDWPQKTLWRMRSSYWTTKAASTHSDYVIIIAFPLQQWLHERALMLRYVLCLLQRWGMEQMPGSQGL